MAWKIAVSKTKKPKKKAPPKPEREKGKVSPAKATSLAEKVEATLKGEVQRAEVIPPGKDRDEPQETTSVTMERKTALPMFGGQSVDLDAEMQTHQALPKFQCDTCAIGPECPEYKAGYVCAFNKAFDAFPVHDADSVMALMRLIINKNKMRLMRALLSEEIVSGGQLDMNVTRMSEVVLGQVRELLELSRESQRVTVAVTAAKGAGGGVLSRLFGGGTVERQVPLELNPANSVESLREVLDAADAEARASEEVPVGVNEEEDEQEP